MILRKQALDTHTSYKKLTAVFCKNSDGQSNVSML